MAKKMAKRAVSLLCVVMLLASVLVVPASANNNAIDQLGYYDDGGEGHPHIMGAGGNNKVSCYFTFRGNDIQSLNAYCPSGKANLSFHDMDWNGIADPNDPSTKTYSGWLDIMPTSMGKFSVFIFVNDSSGASNGVYTKIYIDAVWMSGDISIN